MLTRLSSTVDRGPGAGVLSPLSTSCAGGTRLSRFRRDVLQCDCSLRPAAPVQTAAVPHRFFSKPPCFRVRLAQLIFQHAQHSRPPRYTTQQMSNRRDLGPWPQSSALCAERAFNVGMRWDGGGLHRLAGPGREQLSAPCRAILANEPSNTLHYREQGRRLDAVPSACW